MFVDLLAVNQGFAARVCIDHLNKVLAIATRKRPSNLPDFAKKPGKSTFNHSIANSLQLFLNRKRGSSRWKQNCSNKKGPRNVCWNTFKGVDETRPSSDNRTQTVQAGDLNLPFVFSEYKQVIIAVILQVYEMVKGTHLDNGGLQSPPPTPPPTTPPPNRHTDNKTQKPDTLLEIYDTLTISELQGRLVKHPSPT